MEPIDKTTAIPYYQQLAEILKQEIADRRSPNETYQLPSENELAMLHLCWPNILIRQDSGKKRCRITPDADGHEIENPLEPHLKRAISDIAQTKEWVGNRLDELWQGKGRTVVGDLRALDLDQPQIPDEVRQAPGYFGFNLARMRYDQLRAEGYLIESGTVESRCNDVVQHRMHRLGRGWT
jgi:hypothetical protein